MKKSVEPPAKAPPPKPGEGSEQTPSWEYGSPAERYSFHDRDKRPAPPAPSKSSAAEPMPPAENEGSPSSTKPDK